MGAQNNFKYNMDNQAHDAIVNVDFDQNARPQKRRNSASTGILGNQSIDQI